MSVALESVSGELYANDAKVTLGAPGYKNKIINGGFDIWQRGISFDGTSPYYAADRFPCYRQTGTGNITSSREDSNDEFGPYYLKVHRTAGDTAVTDIHVTTSFETVDNYSLMGKEATLSVVMRKGVNFSGANILIDVLYGTGIDGSIVAGFTNHSSAFSLEVSDVTTDFVRYSVSGLIPSNASQLGIAVIYTPTGTAGANDYIDIAQIQLEEGSVATPFERRPIGVELALCQRYYEKGSVNFRQFSTATGQRGSANIDYKQTKRGTPSFSHTVYISQSWSVAATSTNNDTAGINIHFSSTAVSSTGYYYTDWTADAEL